MAGFDKLSPRCALSKSGTVPVEVPYWYAA